MVEVIAAWQWRERLRKACPHSQEQPCTCDGCAGCPGHVTGCTCDIDWDAIYELHELDRLGGVDWSDTGQIPITVNQVYDRNGTDWRRSSDDPRVWVTAGRSRLASTHQLATQYGAAW